MEENDKQLTTISLMEGTKKSLAKLKIHPRQPYDEIIKSLLKYHKMQEELSPVKHQGEVFVEEGEK